MLKWDAKRWPNFSIEEFKCKHTGKCEMDPGFLDVIQSIRTEFGKPMTVTSGYRDITHPVEAKKAYGGGAHTTGKAVDIAVTGPDAYAVVKMAVARGITGIGVAKTFIHLDMAPARSVAPRPSVWVY